MEKGYIKFNYVLHRSKISYSKTADINRLRDKLYKIGLIGAYDNGIGFGNLSIRDGSGFIITGSTTGNKEKLAAKDYVKVIGYDLEKNKLICKGQINPSSESLTHAAIYSSDKDANAVIHIHNDRIWKKFYRILPKTGKNAAYGTVKIAKSVIGLFKKNKLKGKKVILMTDHKPGLISFGKSLNEAAKNLIELLKKS